MSTLDDAKIKRMTAIVSHVFTAKLITAMQRRLISIKDLSQKAGVPIKELEGVIEGNVGYSFELATRLCLALDLKFGPGVGGQIDLTAPTHGVEMPVGGEIRWAIVEDRGVEYLCPVHLVVETEAFFEHYDLVDELLGHEEGDTIPSYLVPVAGQLTFGAPALDGHPVI